MPLNRNRWCESRLIEKRKTFIHLSYSARSKQNIIYTIHISENRYFLTVIVTPRRTDCGDPTSASYAPVQRETRGGPGDGRGEIETGNTVSRAGSLMSDVYFMAAAWLWQRRAVPKGPWRHKWGGLPSPSTRRDPIPTLYPTCDPLPAPLPTSPPVHFIT